MAFTGIFNRRADLCRKYEEAKDRAQTADPAHPQIHNWEMQAVIEEMETPIPKARTQTALLAAKFGIRG